MREEVLQNMALFFGALFLFLFFTFLVGSFLGTNRLNDDEDR